jgi:multidrug efflux pump subunit AcrA (membrane-fusion protein)
VIATGGNLTIDRIYVKEGDFVREGDILFSFETTDIENSVASAAAQVEIARINYETAQSTGREQNLAQANSSLMQAENSYRDAQLNLQRMEALFESNAISQQQMDQARTAYQNSAAQVQLARVNNSAAATNAGQNIRSARAQYQQAQANHRNAQNNLNNRVIKAEIDGVVADIYVSGNVTLSMGERVMDIVDYSDLILEIRVDEYEIAAMTEGKVVDVHVNALSKDVSGYISKISNQATRVGDLSYFVTEIQLEDPQTLRVGLSVEVRVPNVERKGVVTVSMGAVQFDLENNPFVLVGDRNNPRQQSVQVGQNDGVIVEITEGLSEGDVVLVRRRIMRVVPGQGPVME